MPPQRNIDYVFKLVIVGEMYVGKTSLLQRFCYGRFTNSYKATIGVDFCERVEEIGDHVVKAQLWDTAGTEQYRALTNAYFRGARGAVIVYSIDDRRSYERVGEWLRVLETHMGEAVSEISPVVLLIGNKCDLEDRRAVSRYEAESNARKHGLEFIEASARSDYNVERAFRRVLTRIYEQERRKLSGGLGSPWVPPPPREQFETIRLKKPKKKVVYTDQNLPKRQRRRESLEDSDSDTSERLRQIWKRIHLACSY